MYNIIRYLKFGLVQMRATALSLGYITLFAKLVQSARQFVDYSYCIPVGRIATIPHKRFLYHPKYMIYYIYINQT